MAPGAPLHATVAWITDIEGRWDKLEDFARGNPSVSLSPTGALTVAPGAVFVFGGDAVDRGPAGQRIVRTLVEAYDRQPDQVVLLAGNRDINKLRLPGELGGRPPPRTPAALLDGPRPALLQWLLAHTMGARQAFEHRRTELAARGDAHDDHAVTESFVTDVAPDGLHTRYLQRSQLMYRHEASLFVHGFVTPETLGAVPGCVKANPDVDDWIVALNAWYRNQVLRHVHGEVDADGNAGCAPLVAYQGPEYGARTNDASVVYARPTDDAGVPYLPAPSVVDVFRRAGIRRMLVGHTPSGDAPGVLRCDGFELVLGDNSYGRIEGGSRVLVRGDEMSVQGRTVTDDGTVRDVDFTTSLDDGDGVLGKRDGATGLLVKARLADGAYAVYRRLPDNKVEQRVVDAPSLASTPLIEPWRPPRRAT